jgi:sigma-B regulation protein RsbU (phosphoserine phosphatase)
MVHQRDQAKVQRYVQRVLDGENPPPCEHRIYRKDGATRWIRNTIVPQYDATGKLIHYDGIVEDITQRKRAERVARRRNAQLLAAQRIQKQLLPDAPPVVKGFDIAGAVYPAELVAGDLYDFLPILDGSLGIVVGDVSGHGFGAALFMATTHATLCSLALLYTDVAEILDRTNSALVKKTREERFVSLFFGRLDSQTGSLIYANAGHPEGVVLAPSGKSKAFLHSTSLPLGVTLNARFCVSQLTCLAPGDTLLLFTDGLLEATSPQREMFGIQRVLEVVQTHQAEPAADIVAHLHHEVAAFHKKRRLADDVTILVVKREPYIAHV